jgi:hypothetical protein
MDLGLMQPRATQTKESTTMRSMHLGLLRLGQFKPQKEKMRSMQLGLLHLGQFEAQESAEMRSMHLGLLHLGHFEAQEMNKKQNRIENHGPRATAPGAIKDKEGEQMRSMRLGYCPWGNSI